MLECLASTNYTLRADIYRPSITQDVTGAVIKSWEYEATINCLARSIIRKGTGENSTFLEIEEYLNQLNSMVKLRSNRVIPTDRIIVNIRNKDTIIYKEDQDPSSAGGFGTSTIFEVFGSSPLINFDGKIIEYETIIRRREIQEITIS